MNSNKYTLDRYEAGFGVFLRKDNENIQKLVPQEQVEGLLEGDIVVLQFEENGDYKGCEKLVFETELRKKEVEGIIGKLTRKSEKDMSHE